MTAFNLLRNNAGLITLGILLSLLSTTVTLFQPALVGQLISGVMLSAGSWYRGYGSVVLPVSG